MLSCTPGDVPALSCHVNADRAPIEPSPYYRASDVLSVFTMYTVSRHIYTVRAMCSRDTFMSPRIRLVQQGAD